MKHLFWISNIYSPLGRYHKHKLFSNAILVNCTYDTIRLLLRFRLCYNRMIERIWINNIVLGVYCSHNEFVYRSCSLNCISWHSCCCCCFLHYLALFGSFSILDSRLTWKDVFFLSCWVYRNMYLEVI